MPSLGENSALWSVDEENKVLVSTKITLGLQFFTYAGPRLLWRSDLALKTPPPYKDLIWY